MRDRIARNSVMQYSDLPDVIKAEISEREWLWLTEIDRERYLQGLTEPEEEEFIDG